MYVGVSIGDQLFVIEIISIIKMSLYEMIYLSTNK